MPHTDWKARLGLWRSLLMYYAIPGRQARMTRFYGQFIGPGDLCFDIGAHVGNRLRVWQRLGARSVALEPQPLFIKTLKQRYGASPDITLIGEAVGATPGSATLHISSRTPTVTTLSADWMAKVRQDPSFRNVNWDQSLQVPVTTLDTLIATYGLPRFCKIDVEGFETEVLRGLSQALPALSFEYLPATIGLATECIDLLDGLGNYEYNRSEGESHRLAHSRWLDGSGMCEVLQGIRRGSGDVYARLRNS